MRGTEREKARACVVTLLVVGRNVRIARNEDVGRRRGYMVARGLLFARCMGDVYVWLSGWVCVGGFN